MIEPALTTDEWAQKWDGHDDDATPMRYTFGVAVYMDRPHASAALALHGQPFGFTWDDVDAIRHAAKMARTWDEVVGDPDVLDGLADRIAALLPPREAA
jgi:hypothetical protein